MQETNVRVGALDDLAIEFQHQAQHAVGGWVLRPKIERVVFDLSHTSLQFATRRLRSISAQANFAQAKLSAHSARPEPKFKV
jgi:hypothetical protein